MPKLESPSDVITRITAIDDGETDYLAIHGLARDGRRDVLITGNAARDLWAKLDSKFRRREMSDLEPSDFITS